MNLDELYTAADASRELGVAPGSVAKFAKRHGMGKLISGVYFFTREDVDYMRARRRYGRSSNNKGR